MAVNVLTYDARKLKHKIDGKKFIKLVLITRVYGDVRSTKLLKKNARFALSNMSD